MKGYEILGRSLDKKGVIIVAIISEADIMKEYLSDLGMGYVLTLIGGISMIVKKYKQVK